MSSILEALKKAEAQQPEARQADLWSHEFNTAQAIRKKARRAWILRTGLTLGIILIFVGLGSLYVYKNRSTLKEAASASRKPAEKMTLAKEPPRVSMPTETEPEPEKAEEARAAVQPVPGGPRPVSASKVLVEQPAELLEPVSARAPVVTPVEPLPPDQALKEAVIRDTPRAAPAREGSEEAPPEPVAEDLDLSGYKLEAIVWAESPGSRFAVINGSIVKAGADLGDVSVTSIERNGVKLRSGSRRGELRFTME